MSAVKTVFVTGGSGFIGRSLVRLLCSKGFKVKALARSDKSQMVIKELGATPIRGEIWDLNILFEATEGCDAIFHLAGVVSYQMLHRSSMLRTNLEGTKNILKAAERNHVSQVIYCSTVSVLGGSQGEVRNETSVHSGVYASWYEKSKCLAHAAVVEFSKNHPGVVIAMPALAMGPGGDDILGVYIKAFCEKKLPFLVALENPVSYVHVDDLAEGLCLCMEKGVSGQQYIFSADDCTPNQLADFLSRFSGKPKPRFILPPNLATPLLFIDELISYLTHKRPALTIESLKVLKQKSWIYSGEKARKELGWRPRSMEQMVQATVN